MTHGSLFSGIGGFDLAAEWMGWQNVFHCEWNPFGQKVLKYYWPEAESFTDITKTDFKKYANQIDILTGGFPCQPYSSAGKRLGKADERHLWPEMLRAIREIEPTYIVGENVRGLLNWNGGMVFDEVCAELENLGYQVAPCLIPACGVGAPHRRERIWFVAYSSSSRFKTNNFVRESKESFNFTGLSCKEFSTNTDSNGFNQCNGKHEVNTSERWEHALNDIEPIIMHANGTSIEGEYIGQKREGKFNRPDSRNEFNRWQNFPTVSPICNGNDGLPDRLDGITFSKWRAESIKAGGNAIVSQVAYQIFQTIQKLHNDLHPM